MNETMPSSQTYDLYDHEGLDPYWIPPDSPASSPERRLFHRILVALNAPADWPIWLVAGVALLLIGLVSAFWQLLLGGRWGLYIGTVAASFALADVAILIQLPRRRLSFGPGRAQFIILQLPRWGVILAGALLGRWIGPLPALAGVALIQLGASLALAWGALRETAVVGLSQLSLPASPMPPGAPPIRMLHISDLHVERFGRREEQLLSMVRDLKPDLIVLTGDYVSLSCVEDPAAHADVRRVLAGLSAPGGVYAVLGSPPVDRNSAKLFAGLPIRLLRNDTAIADVGQGRRLAILGVECSHTLEVDRQRLAAVAAHAPSSQFRVLLHHAPDLMPVAPQFNIGLYVCGHTHGGQVRLPLYGALFTSSRLGKRYEMGHYELDKTHMYVSRGVGLEGMGAPRVRFLCPPEIALLCLDAFDQVSLPDYNLSSRRDPCAPP